MSVPNRRLAAILAADVVGYSRLMGQDEEGTHRRVRELRTIIIEPRLSRHAGRLFKTTGDGFLIEFGSVVSAFRYASEVQDALRASEPTDTPDALQLRIGINVGDVIADDDGDIFGDGVNIAARIEQICPPGGICVSERAWRDLRQQPVLFTDLGPQVLKNISDPIRAYVKMPEGQSAPPTKLHAATHDEDHRPAPRAMAAAPGVDRRVVIAAMGGLAIAGAGASWWSGLFGGTRNANSIAVLPFANLSGDPREAYFSDGVAAEIRSELARNPLLQVAAQTSSESFRKSDKDAKTISSKLRVSHLLDGNIRKSGDMVRVSVELTEGNSGFSTWSQRFDRPLADVFAVQDEIAQAVASALSVELSRKPGENQKHGTSNFAAYDAYLKGNALYQLSSGEESTRDALTKYEAATALDPGYAAAWSAQSRTLAALANQYLDGNARAATFDNAIAVARKSLALDPDLADAHSALGYATLFGRRNVRAARAPFERSAQLGQGQSDVLTRYASYCAFAGEFDKARTAIFRAAKLDPLNALAQRSTGTVEFAARRYPESIAALRRALVLNPQLNGANAAIAFNQLMMGRVKEAARSVAAEKSDLRRLTGEAMVAQRLGDMAKAQSALRRIESEFGTRALYEQAQVLAQWGETDRGMAALLRAAETGDPGLVLIKTDPLIDALRKRPEFSGLLKQVGFG